MICKAFIPIAGLGRRMAPMTDFLPKELLPILNVPVIEIVITELVDAGIREFYFIINKDKILLNEYVKHLFQRSYTQCECTFIVQRKPRGLGDAILTASDYVRDDEYFMVALPDNIFYPSTAMPSNSLMTLNAATGLCAVTISSVATDEVEMRALVKLGEKKQSDAFQVDDIIDKPKVNLAAYEYAISGRYIINGDVLKYIDRSSRHEIEFTNALLEYRKNYELLGLIHSTKKFDVGNPKGYYNAFKEIGGLIYH